MSANIIPTFPFTPQGFTGLQRRFNRSRDDQLQQAIEQKFVAADIAFLSSGSRSTSHLLPGTKFKFHPLFITAQAARSNERADFNFRTKRLLTDVVSAAILRYLYLIHPSRSRQLL